MPALARPVPTTPFQEELYAQIAAWADADPGVWDLLNYIGAIASMFDQIETYARDQPDGRPGYAILMDPDTAPSEALGWLAQFVGVGLQDGLSDAAQRARIKSTDGFKRGTAGAIVGAAQQYLTGTKTVILRERDPSVDVANGGAYGFTVLTYASETPDQAAVLAALTAQKPAGLLMQYNVVTGANYLLIRTTYATYTTLRAGFATYNGLRNNAPGT
jgi:hypothetical protein